MTGRDPIRDKEIEEIIDRVEALDDPVENAKRLMRMAYEAGYEKKVGPVTRSGAPRVLILEDSVVVVDVGARAQDAFRTWFTANQESLNEALAEFGLRTDYNIAMPTLQRIVYVGDVRDGEQLLAGVDPASPDQPPLLVKATADGTLQIVQPAPDRFTHEQILQAIAEATA